MRGVGVGVEETPEVGGSREHTAAVVLTYKSQHALYTIIATQSHMVSTNKHFSFSPCSVSHDII